MKSIITAFIFATRVSTAWAGEATLPYSAFGPQVAAYKLIGMEWWQWDSHGDSRPRDYPIKAVVFWDQTLEETAKNHPVDQAKLRDYRYVEYSKAVEHMERTIEEFKEAEFDASPIERALTRLKKQKAERLSDGNPHLPLYSRCSHVISTSTPRSTLAPASGGAITQTFGFETMADAPTETVMSAILCGAAAFIGIPILHAIFMKVDLSLRDPKSATQGGIPDWVTMIFQYGSLVLFGVLVFLALARIDSVTIRLFLSALATAVAYALMLFSWLHYITGNGIDTL